MSVPTPAEQVELFRVHVLRMQTHWGKSVDVSKFAWPKTEAEWRQTGHGAPWDTNVHMARWALKFAQAMADEGLVVL